MRIRDVMVELGSSPHARGGRGPGGRGSCVVRLIPACAGRARSARRSRTRRAAHPRMRGEGPARVLSVAWVIGSSPHARGGRVDGDLPGHPARLIPACAGRARPALHVGAGLPAHPRMRGEGVLSGNSGSAWVGSSPHARGGLSVPPAGDGRAGLIPACAGRACRPAGRHQRRGAHPRMRGEGAEAMGAALRGEGSSPHARGGHPALERPGAFDRLIPACAGRARRSASHSGVSGAHPRMRGEGICFTANGSTTRGSSPHARGGRDGQGQDRGGQGLIPACAGRAASGKRSVTCGWAHPRMRGEGYTFGDPKWHLPGSSPHARGGPAGAALQLRQERLIPACAGRAGSECHPRTCAGAHPRMRGEGALPRLWTTAIVGSSPHARGGRAAAGADGLPHRLIPACAGRAMCWWVPG